METLIKNLKRIETNNVKQDLNIEKLKETQFLLDSVSEIVKTKIIELSRKEEEEDDEGYIEIVVNGKPDLIKKDIKELNISCNNFKILPEAVYKLKNLRKLYLYSNNFSDEEKKNIRKRFPLNVQLYF